MKGSCHIIAAPRRSTGEAKHVYIVPLLNRRSAWITSVWKLNANINQWLKALNSWLAEASAAPNGGPAPPSDNSGVRAAIGELTLGKSMFLTALPFPVTIVARDWWAEYMKAAENIRDWGMHGVRKYSRIGFIVADANGSVWRMVNIVPERKLKIWECFRLMPVRVPTSVTVEPAVGDSLTVFREHFSKALEKDDDILGQFRTKEKIKSMLRSSDSLPKLLATLHKDADHMTDASNAQPGTCTGRGITPLFHSGIIASLARASDVRRSALQLNQDFHLIDLVSQAGTVHASVAHSLLTLAVWK